MNGVELRQLLENYDYPAEPIRCTECGTALRDGARCGFVARHPDDMDEWVVMTTYCIEDMPKSAPESPVAEVALAVADVASLVRTAEQSHGPCLTNVDIHDTDLGLAIEEATA